MLWEASNRLETKRKENDKKCVFLQRGVAALKESIVAARQQLIKRKKENVELQFLLNQALITKINQYQL